MTALWLVRHGQTDWNLSGIWQGQASDAPGLNETGRTQAIAVREQLRDLNIAAVYSSDLLRAVQTAELIAEPFGLAINLEPRLREINLGVWEGMPSAEVEAQYSQELAERARNPFLAHVPNGESPREVAERVLQAVNEIVADHLNDSVVIVSHGVALGVMICHAEGILMDEIYEHIPDNAQPYCVQWPIP
jgi:broad specificity phosphatase PhoE